MSAFRKQFALLGETADNSRFGDCPLSAQSLSDFVGFGGTNCFEGSGPITGLTVTKAALRKNNGCTDTNAPSTRARPRSGPRR